METVLKLRFDGSGGKPIAEIGLGTLFGRHTDHNALLTEPCENFGAFSEAIRSLHNELDLIEAEAKQKFSSASVA